MESLKGEVSRLFIRKKPEGSKPQASITEFDGSVPIYSANYEASQEQLARDFEEQGRRIQSELRSQTRKRRDI